jgi:hypothetical protein
VERLRLEPTALVSRPTDYRLTNQCESRKR